MSTYLNAFNFITSHLSWGAQKAIQAVKSDSIYIATPLLVCAATTYKGAQHALTATIGVDSLKFRKQLIQEAFSEKELHLSKRLYKLQTACTGSILLKDRAYEAALASLYFGTAMGSAYALHAYLKKGQPQSIQIKSDLDPATQEIYPKEHAWSVLKNTLDIIEKNEDFFMNQLKSPESVAHSITAKMTHEIVLNILHPAKNSVGKLKDSFLSSACSFTSYNTSFCNTTTYKTLDEFSLEDSHLLIEESKKLYQKYAPYDWQKRAASWVTSICNRTWGLVSSNIFGDCQNIEAHFDDTQKKQLQSHLSLLDRLDNALAQRFLLQGKSDCSNPLSNISEAACNLFTKKTNLTLSQASKFLNKQGELFRSFQNFNQVLPSYDSVTEETLHSFHQFIESILEKAEENAAFLRKSISVFFKIPMNFTKENFTEAYRALMKEYHSDKCKDKEQNLCEIVHLIANKFKELVNNKDLHFLQISQMDSNSSSLDTKEIPYPSEVVTEIFNEFKTWLKAPIPLSKQG